MKIAVISLLIFVVFLLFGLLSTAVSLRQCELRVASWLNKDIMQENPFDVFPSEDAWVLNTFLEVGANVRPKDKPGDYSPDYHFANLEHARIKAPYVARTNWEYLRGFNNGRTGYSTVLCLFGRTVMLRNVPQAST